MNDPQFEVGQKPYDNSAFTPEPPRKQRGCFFYGCIIALVVGLIGLILVGASAYIGYTWLMKVRDEYTSTSPAEIAQVNLPEEQRKSLDERVAAYKKASEEGAEYELVLTADEINALIDENENLKGKFYLTLDGDKVSAKMSWPLGDTGLPGLKGRYLNGSASLKASIKDGQLDVRAQEIVVNDKPMPPEVKSSIANENLAKEFSKNPKNNKFMENIESFEIKDSKVYIKTKKKVIEKPADSPKVDEDAKSKEDPAPKDKAKEEPPQKQEDPKPKEVETPKKAA